MKLDEFRKYLSFIADVATIVGVSFFGIFGNRILSLAFARQFSFFDFITAALIFSVFTAAFLLFILIMTKRVFRDIKQRDWIGTILNLFCFLMIWILLFFLGGRIKDELASMLNNEYLLPTPPVKVIVGINPLDWNPENGEIKGKVVWKKNNVSNDKYCVLAYVKYANDSHLKVHKFLLPTKGGSKECILTKISKEGSFVVPSLAPRSVTIGNTLERVAIAVLREADCHLYSDYPSGILQTDDPALESIGAFCVELPQSIIQNVAEKEGGKTSIE